MGNPAPCPGPSKTKCRQAGNDSCLPGTFLGALFRAVLILVTLCIAPGLCQTSQEDKDALLMFQGGISDDQVSLVRPHKQFVVSVLACCYRRKPVLLINTQMTDGLDHWALYM